MAINYKMIAVAVLIIGGVLAWRIGVWNDANNPEAAGKPIVTVNVPQLAGSAREGEQLFNENCAICHGRNAAGQEGVAPPLVHLIYEPNHHSDDSFYLAVENGVVSHHWPFGDMPKVPGLQRQSVGKIIAYVRTLQRANGIE